MIISQESNAKCNEFTLRTSNSVLLLTYSQTFCMPLHKCVVLYRERQYQICQHVGMKVDTTNYLLKTSPEAAI